jgi:hypothetical protein
MNYQLRGLEPASFEKLFDLDDETLAARGMRRMRSDRPVGYPCRVSLEDTPVGEDVLLLTFTHQDSRSPYRASGPIFVRQGQARAARVVNALATCLKLRPLSVRAYDAADEMVDAEVVDGAEAEPLIRRYLARAAVAYLHIHFARRGCFACRVDRA